MGLKKMRQIFITLTREHSGLTISPEMMQKLLSTLGCLGQEHPRSLQFLELTTQMQNLQWVTSLKASLNLGNLSEKQFQQMLDEVTSLVSTGVKFYVTANTSCLQDTYRMEKLLQLSDG